MDTQAPIVAACQHIFHVDPVSIVHVLEICFTGYKYVSELLYPGEVPLEAVDVQLRLLGEDVGADGEEILTKRAHEISSLDKLNPNKISVSSIRF